jgi:hypothetical protein
MAQTFRPVCDIQSRNPFMVAVVKDDENLLIDSEPSVVPMWWISAEYAKQYGKVK